MRIIFQFVILISIGATLTSCVTKKKYLGLQTDLNFKQAELDNANKDLATKWAI